MSTAIAERWLEHITGARELRKVVRRGRVTAGRGRVKNLQVRPGLLTAEVHDDSGGTHSVKIRMVPIHDDLWGDVIEIMAQEATYAAAIAGGRVTDAVLDIYDEVSADLFPTDFRDLTHFCVCSDLSAPVCVHAMATHMVFAEAIVADPFVLLEFRGRSHDEITSALRTERSGALGEMAAAPVEDDDETEPIAVLADGYWRRGIVPHLAFHFTLEDSVADLDDAAALPVIRALGPAPGDTRPEVIAEVLAPIAAMAVRRMREVVDRVQDDTHEGPDPNRATSLDDMLVAAAHQHGALTSGLVSNALGCSAYEARRYLMWLVEEGRLQRVGRARGTKYVPI